MRTEGPWTPVGSVVSSGQPALGGAIIKAYPHHLGLSACFITASFITASFNNTFLGRSIARRPAQAGCSSLRIYKIQTRDRSKLPGLELSLLERIEHRAVLELSLLERIEHRAVHRAVHRAGLVYPSTPWPRLPVHSLAARPNPSLPCASRSPASFGLHTVKVETCP